MSKTSSGAATRRVRERWARVTGHLRVARRVARHPHTPRSARLLASAALAYAASPVDLIPDWVPVLGYLDDVLIVPLLLWLAWRRVPPDVLAECRAACQP